MRKELPVRPNLEHLKSQAKDLLEAYRRGEREAFERLRAALPAAGGVSDEGLAAMGLALHDAQSAVAREYGFASWAELRTHVEQGAPTPELLSALLRSGSSIELPAEVQQALLEAASRAPEVGAVPSPLPLLALRNAALTVGAVAPLHIGRASSAAAVEAAQSGDKLMALFAQKDSASEAPAEADLHPIGCAVQLLSVTPAADGKLWIVVRAVRWIRLEAVETGGQAQHARFVPFEVREEQGPEVQQLEQSVRARMRALAAKLPGSEYLLRKMEAMNALQLADAAVANLPLPVGDKARYASEPSLTERLKLVATLLNQTP